LPNITHIKSTFLIVFVAHYYFLISLILH